MTGITSMILHSINACDASGRIEQAGAICLRPSPQCGGLEILLIASSSTGTWGLPKGHIEPRETSSQAALREAGEEAGVEGYVTDAACGSFSYRKPFRAEEYFVTVHMVMVGKLRDHYAESSSRVKKWVPLHRACREVANPELAGILERVAQTCLGISPTA